MAVGCISAWDIPSLPTDESPPDDTPPDDTPPVWNPLPDTVEITYGPFTRPTDSTELHLVHVLEVSTDRPTELTVELSGAGTTRQIKFPREATTHVVPLLGLVELENYVAQVTLETSDGLEVTAVAPDFNAGDAPDPVPDRDVSMSDPTRMEPGYTLYPTKGVHGSVAVVEAVDDQGRLVWQFCPPSAPVPEQSSVTAIQFHESDGSLSGLVNRRSIRRFDLAMMTRDDGWAPLGSQLGLEKPVTMGLGQDETFHDEAAFAEDGTFWTLYKTTLNVEDYPLDQFDLSILGDATIDVDVVVHVDTDGTVLGEWVLSDYLDTSRIGFDATLGDLDGRIEWSSANAIVPLSDESFLVSLRHQDAVVKISGDELEWIFANHDGWSEEFQPYLIAPEGLDLMWFSHQEAPHFDEKTGSLWLFDNGGWDRGTPYNPVPDVTDYSRIVHYAIDEFRSTARETFSFVADNDTFPLYANVSGNADPLPSTGNVLGTWGALMSEDGVANVDADLGIRTMRIIEVAPDGTPVFDLRISGAYDISNAGWQGDRAIRIPSLYPAEVVVTEL